MAVAGQLALEQQRWFLWVPVAFGAGIAGYFRLGFEPPLVACLLPFVAIVVLAGFMRRSVTGLVAAGILLSASAGLAVVKLRTAWLAAPVLEQQLRRVELRGLLELVEPRQGGAQRLSLRVTQLGALAPERLPALARVTTRAANPELRPGQMIRIVATLGPPGQPVLPGGYDFARYAYFQQIGAVGYSRQRAEVLPVAHDLPWALRWSINVQQIRQRIGRRVTAALPGEPGAIANALLTGERGGISDATNSAYRDSGLFHILSISGLHMVVMGGAIFFALRLVFAAFPSVALRYPVKKWGALGAVFGTLAYLTISGGSFATVRSYIMISIMFLAIMLDRPAVALRNVALAALLILVLYPESIHNVGFQMSFAAVVALVAAYEALRDRDENRGRGAMRGRLMRLAMFFAGIVLTTLVASAAVAPFAAYHFHKSQQYAVLANLIAIPICNVIVMPAALATFLALPFGLEAVPLWLMGKGIEAMNWCANAVAGLPGAVGLLPTIPTIAFASMLAGGLWLCLWRRRWRLLGLLPILAGLLLAPGKPPPDVLISREGKLIAVRGLDGRLSALPHKGGNYELSRWLESDGDGRKPEAVATGAGFRCDGSGCTARLPGQRAATNGEAGSSGKRMKPGQRQRYVIAVVRDVAALRDDCRLADIIVVPFPAPRWCHDMAARRGSAHVIDSVSLRRSGAVAIRIGEQGFVVDTVTAHRGLRPWSQAPPDRRHRMRSNRARMKADKRAAPLPGRSP